MRLIGLYVENFGGLHRFSLDFEAGITTVLQPNGFGKTTLAEFIRAMFYGFPRKGKTLEKSRRQKYTPWNGGSFGGNLTFELEDGRYRIERTFGAVPKEDTFVLIDLRTNRKTTRFTEEIGIELFGVDAESFERSIYLPQMQEEGIFATASIQARLTNLVEGDPDVANFDKAVASLRAKRSALIPYRGSGGAAADAAQRIARLQTQLDQALMQREEQIALENAAAQTEAELQKVKAELDGTVEELASASAKAAAALTQRQYQALRQRCQAAAAQLEALRQKYPSGFPEDSRLEKAEKTADRLMVLEARVPAEWRTACEKRENLQARLRMLEDTAAQLEAEQQRQIPQQRYIPQLLGGILGTVLGVAALCLGGLLFINGMIPDGVIAAAFGAAALSVGIWLLAVRHKKRILQRQEQNFNHRALHEKHTAVKREIETLHQAVQLGAAIRACREELDAFFESCAAAPETDVRGHLRRIREDSRDAAAVQRTLQVLTGEMREMEGSFGEVLQTVLSGEPDVSRLRLREQHLRRQQSVLESCLTRQKQQAKLLQSSVEGIPQLREDLDTWVQKREKYREEVRILDETMNFLRQARERLSTVYLDTVRSRFGDYLTQMRGSGGERCFVDASFQVQTECMGQSRELAYFSTGEVDLVMLCMRLALVDALFSDQEMFVVLDDPFVNLDDAHLEQARSLLRELSRRRQVLYLTCHSSRMIEQKN